MNPYYKESVFFFGVIIPLLVVVSVFVIMLRYKGKLEDSYRLKKSAYVEIQKIEKQRLALESKVATQDPHMKRWMALFDKPTASSVNGFLTQVQKKFAGEEFQQIAFRRGNSSGGIGGASAQPSIQIQLGFRGTYSALQNAFVELETSMPQLQLDSMKVTPNVNRKVLNADLVYTAWQNE